MTRTSSCLPSITFEAATSWLPKNVARNSPAISSSFEFMSLELQRFRVVSKNDRVKLRAKFVWRWCRCRLRAPWPGPAASHGHRGQALQSLRRRASKPALALRALRRHPRRCWWGFCTIRSPPSACRRRVAALMVQFPRLVVVRPGLEVVCSPKCRPIRQKAPKIGHFKAMGLHFGGIGACKRVG